MNSNTNNDSDSDTYVDLSTNFNSQTQNIFQFIVNDQTIELKHIGKFTKVPDIIIKENFGPQSNMNLYNCVYTLDEILDESSNIYPLVKLIIQNESNTITSCISVKLNDDNQFISDNTNSLPIENWDLFWICSNSNSENIKISKIEKNINPSNIIEKLIAYSINN